MDRDCQDEERLNLRVQICSLPSAFILTISVHPCLNSLSVEAGVGFVPAQIILKHFDRQRAAQSNATPLAGGQKFRISVFS
jgi:hypothetical protein